MPSTVNRQPSTGLLHPRYWPTWIALGVLRVFEPLPYPLLVSLGRAIGTLLIHLPLPFVRIARRNIELCLPERTKEERERILREHFRSVGIGIFETAIAWWSSDERIRKLTHLDGEEHLEAALARMAGAVPPAAETVVLAETVRFTPPLAYFLPVRVRTAEDGRQVAVPQPFNTSGDLGGLVGTDGFLELPADVNEFPSGSTARFWRWR